FMFSFIPRQSRILQTLRPPTTMASYSSTSNDASSSSPPTTGAYTAENHVRRPDHTPQTGQIESETYILTLHTDAKHHRVVTDLRTKYFPPQLNKLSAHITLFRALPGSQLSRIEKDIHEIAQQHHPFFISTGKPHKFVEGVSLDVRAVPAQEIYHALKARWTTFLSKQDHIFRPHYTIQNKVPEKEVVEKTMDEIQGSFTGSRGTADGLTLHRYEKGYWLLKELYLFPVKEEQQVDSAGDGKTGEDD
ncbi:MAG: hypothetical protein Q9183_005980, partial [Haloplaca sp. 2 TL-2023]